MPQIASFSEQGLNAYFQSARAHIDGNVVAQLVQFIESASKTLDCAIYDLKHPEIVSALKRVADKIQLRIAFDGGKQKAVAGGSSLDPKPSGTDQIIKAAGLSKYATAVHVIGSHLMHSKYIIRDSDTVWTGSGNWTHGGLELQDNNFLVISSPQLADAYKRNFEAIISSSHTHPARPKKADTAHLISLDRAIKVSTKLAVSPYFSGGGTEEIENVVVARIKKAKKLRIMAMLISDPGILDALTLFKPANKDIKGVVDPHEMLQVMKPRRGGKTKDYSLFWFANGDKRFVAAPSHAFSHKDENDFMHNKVMIIDDRFVITGSYNFSENAESNDENILILDSSEIAGAYTKYFEALFERYQKHGALLPP